MTFEQWYETKEQAPLNTVRDNYQFILLDCCAFGFSKRDFLESLFGDA